MGGRHFDQRNRRTPACVIQLAAEPPACFTPVQWREYLEDCWRGTLNDMLARNRLNRGERPDYCSDCTKGYQARMQAAGRCHPPVGANDPNDAAPGQLSLPGCEAGEPLPPALQVAPRICDRLDSAAPDAEKTSADPAGGGVKMQPPALAYQPVPQGKARSGCDIPAGVGAPAGLCAEVACAA